MQMVICEILMSKDAEGGDSPGVLVFGGFANILFINFTNNLNNSGLHVP